MAAGGKDEKFGMLMEEPDHEKVKFKSGTSWITAERIGVLVLVGLGVILIITGIALIVVASSKADKCDDKRIQTTSEPSSQTSERCEYSSEAARLGLNEFLQRVKTTYYELHPYNIPYDPDVDNDESLDLESAEKVKRWYVAYDPTPSVIRERTDTSLALLEEFNNKEIDLNALKPRERKAVAQIQHYLQHVFGQPYDVNYYAGDWMMGPNLFCWQPVCYHGYDLYNGIGLYHKPYNASDVELIKTKLEGHKDGILQYIENMKMGIRKGMVRSVEECVAGADSIKVKYLNVSLHNETGQLQVFFFVGINICIKL